MRKHQIRMIGIASIILFAATYTVAQQKISIDLSAIRNLHSEMNGLNVSGFYYFNKRLSAGVELNRFFPVDKTINDEPVIVSAWDIDINLHYLFSLSESWKVYPLTGFSHTAEKEQNKLKDESTTESFWSFNTGAGIVWEGKHLSPHIEYSYTWGRMNQQFILAGISYEIELGGKKRKP